MNLREKLLGLPPKIETIDCPEIGEAVYLRVMSGHERAAWQKAVYFTGDKADTTNCFARLLIFCLCDSTGQRLFADNEADKLGECTDGSLLEKLFWRARKLNKLDAGALDDSKKD